MKTMRKISVVVLMFYYTTGVDYVLIEHSSQISLKKICSIDFSA